MNWVRQLLCLMAITVSFANASEQTQHLLKSGEYRYFYRSLFKLYDIELFLSEDCPPAEILTGEHAFELHFRYLRSIEKARIIQAAERMLEKNLNPTEREQISKQVEAINRTYRSVQNGDRSALVYHPEAGTTLWINDQALTTIPGKDFGRYYFRIWFGDHPLSIRMRDTLLGL